MPLPLLDVSEPEKLVTPPDFDQVFGMGGPLELEIGCGKGGFANGYAAKYPDRRLIAMEWRVKYADMTRREAEKRDLKNLLVLRCDAKLIVPRIFRNGQLDGIHLHFPDPWWKRRHFKRRVVDVDFSKMLRDLLKPTGVLDVRTDVEHRAFDMLKILTTAGFVNPDAPGFAPWDPEEVPSSREHRYLARGEPVWRLRLKPA